MKYGGVPCAVAMLPRGDKQKISEAFRAVPNPADMPMPVPDYNIAPSTYQPIIRESRESGEREIVLAR